MPPEKTKAKEKTTVYLPSETAERLRRMAAATGRSQAELIREGVGRVLEKAPPRTFHSMGRGRGSGEARPRWSAAGVYEKVHGRAAAPPR